MGKKVKTLESGGYTPAFSRLWAFGGGFMVGVWLIYRGEVNDLWS